MSFEFREARRANVPLLIGIAGPSGAGKTYSAMLLAKGLAGGKQFAFLDTESGRGLHYADEFEFLHANLGPPFSPERYGDAIKAAAALNPPVIVVDSASHEHAGEGGVLDLHESELQRLAGDDYKRREAMKFAAWIKPKAMHKRLVAQLLQLRTHLILCLRAEERIDLVKDPQTGKLEVKPKRTLAGHVGWIPVAGKDLPYELTLSLVVTPDAPGVPKPIKLQEQHRPFVPLDQPLSEETGSRLAAWAAGTDSKVPLPRDGEAGATASASPAIHAAAAESDVQAFLELAASVGDETHRVVLAAVQGQRAKHGGRVGAEWLERQRAKLAERKPAAPPAVGEGGSLFAGMVPESARGEA